MLADNGVRSRRRPRQCSVPGDGGVGRHARHPSSRCRRERSWTVNADGTFNYDPNHLFDYLPASGSGASDLTVTDTFTYAITGGDTATVTVTVAGVDTDDVLLDSPGIDSLAGGIGNDVYYVSNTGDVVTEAASAGSDTVAANVDYTLPASNTVEVLNMLGSGLTGTGTDGPEMFISSNGPHTLVGLAATTSITSTAPGDVVTEPRTAASTPWKRPSTTRCRPATTSKPSTCSAPG